MKSTQQIVILYLALFSIIACKKDNPTPAPDPRDKFLGTYHGTYTITGLCSDTNKLFYPIGTKVNIDTVSLTISKKNGTNEISFLPGFSGTAKDSTIIFSPIHQMISYSKQNDLYIMMGATGSLNKDEFNVSFPIIDQYTLSGVTWTCTGFYNYNLKKNTIN